MVKKKSNVEERTQQVAVRLPLSVVERVQNHATRIGRRAPGVRIHRADAFRVLLIEALDQAERRERPELKT